MADFAPNVTPRYRLSYNAVGRGHTMLFRGARGLTFTQMQDLGNGMALALFTDMAPILASDLVFTNAEVALTDSDLFFPCLLPPAVAGAEPVANYSRQDSITHTTFSGRGSLGSRVSVHLYGVNWQPDLVAPGAPNDFKVLASEDVRVAAAIGHLNSLTHDIRTVDNTKPTFHNYATIKVNDFWLRRVRQGL